MSESHICVGVISGSYGVHGELRIKSFCAVPEDIEKYSPLTDEAGEREYMLAILRPITNGFSARLPEISNKEDAELDECLNLSSPTRDSLDSKKSIASLRFVMYLSIDILLMSRDLDPTKKILLLV